MEYVKDVDGYEHKTEDLFTLNDLWWKARQGGELSAERFQTALFKAIKFTENIDWRYESIITLSDILDYYGMCFTRDADMVELADEPPYEKGE